MNLYHFDRQEFWFEQGRLLLRGNNGTGKSRVLALQLPFLLDGDIASNRFEPDRDPAKKMEWNLLLGRFKDRRGYTWIEFGRRDDEGVHHYVTLGCGLQAIEGRGIADRWYFVTPQRVGKDLSLETSNGQPLTRDQLAAQLGGSGKLFRVARDYRREVDTALFGLGEQRYGSLIDLLITLRQPQLSRTLNEEALSSALSDALPPLSSKIIDDIAESMRGLELDREQLESYRTASQAITSFLEHYGRYARVASRRRAGTVRQAQAKFEDTGRQIITTTQSLETTRAESAVIQQQIVTLKMDETAAETEQATLLSSPQMAAAGELKQARQDSEERSRDADQAERDREHVAQQLVRARKALEDASSREAQAREKCSKALATSAECADSIGLRRAHDRVVPSLATLKDERAVEMANSAVVRAIEGRRDQARTLRTACKAAADATSVLKERQQERDRIAGEADSAEGTLRAAVGVVTDRVGEAVAAFRQWYEKLAELAPRHPEALSESLSEWAQTGSGDSPLSSAVRDAVVAAGEQFSRAELELEAQVKVAGSEIADLEQQRDGLLAGRHEPPPPPYTRDSDVREGRAGAPLWALCEFQESVPEHERRGLEAALEAAGLLDAWVLPTGEVVDPRTHDCFLTARDGSALPRERSVLSALRPCTDNLPAAVDEKTISQVLQTIGTGASDHHVWVSVDGAWQNGPLSGHWSKAEVEHIGAAAREATRLRRLASIEHQIQLVREHIRELHDARLALNERRAILKREHDAAPRDDLIRDALAAVAQARKTLTDTRSRLVRADSALAEAREQSELAAARRDQTASDLGLVDWVERLDDFDEAMARYRDACADLWPALRRLVDSIAASEAERSRVLEAESNAAERRERAEQARMRAQAAKTRYETLERTKGAAIKEVVDALQAVKGRLLEIRGLETDAHTAFTNCERQVAILDAQAETLKRQRDEQASARDEAIEAYKRFIATGVLGIAISAKRSLDVREWSTTRLVELARDTEQELSQVDSDDAIWDRLQKQLFEHFKTLEDALLTHDHRPEMIPDGDIFIVRAVFQGRVCLISELYAVLTDEVMQRQMLLDAKERVVLENHLIGEVAQHLHERLRVAEQHVRDMNIELERVPTSSGMVLRFKWEPRNDGPTGLLDARRRLLGAVGTWSPQEREAVGRFLQDRIKAERLANDTGTWQEQLTASLDYRAWHEFVIERKIDGNWKRFTRRTHGTASGGEKVVALMIPMFAAAASHYRSASTIAPRLILLDEAFVGVDADMRAKSMGLLSAFDLDFIMTSEREWCCYSTMPGVAICQLASRPGIDGVYVSSWVWNGREKVQTTTDGRASVSKMVLLDQTEKPDGDGQQQ